MLKRLFSIITISLVLTGSFFSVYNINYLVYADDTTDGWTQVTTNEQLVQAFKYYCKSRDVTLEGSVADAVTSFTTKTYNGIVKTLGIDLDAIQAHIKYRTDGNAGLRFLFDTEGISLYNRIFAQFLQDNNLSVGDEDVNDEVFNGESYNGALIWVGSSSPTVTNRDWWKITQEGTNYKYSYSYLSGLSNGSTLDFSEFNYTATVTSVTNGAYNVYANFTNINGLQVNNFFGMYSGTYTINNGSSVYHIEGYPVIYHNTAYNSYQLCMYSHDDSGSVRSNVLYGLCSISINPVPTTINIVSTVINNNTYEGDTVINNNGDTNNYYPDNPDNPDNPDIPDPNPNPTPDPPTIPDDGGWQDFSLPEMPNDWLIYGMEKKFPFDIPFNILFALSLLNHEPEIPKFEGDIDLQVCTWHYDIDLTPFDDLATILRKFEVLAFIIGLAILTKNLINWG